MSDSAKRRPGRPPNPIPSETVRARCPQPLVRAVREAADRRGLTTSDAVREALAQWLADEQFTAGAIDRHVAVSGGAVNQAERYCAEATRRTAAWVRAGATRRAHG